MKRFMIIALVFVTAVAFSQDRERSQETRQKMQQERQNLTPEQRAELNTKRLAIQLDLTEAQQREVLNLQLEMAKERAKMKQEMKNKADEAGYYEKASKRLDKRKDYQDKMKAILGYVQLSVSSFKNLLSK
jgi:periplasmic protein CpxP/Spy